MKSWLIGIPLVLVVGLTQAQSSCVAKAAEKKLAGSAKTSFLKKCENDARAVCENDNVSQRLSGAAKAAHIKKCVKNAIGT
jgi:hypothetical protein